MSPSPGCAFEFVVVSFWQEQAEKLLGSGHFLVSLCLGSASRGEGVPAEREAFPPCRSTPLDLICSRRSRFCVGEAVSCLKHKTTAHAGCSCSAGELESHKTLGAAALSLKGVKNLGERKKSLLLEGCAALGPLPLPPPSIQKWVWLWF